jgi:hypothetical protein
MYTGSTYQLYNNALREKGMGKTTELKCRKSIQLARKCLLAMQAIKVSTTTHPLSSPPSRLPLTPSPLVAPSQRATPSNTYRGVTGYLGGSFKDGGMGMDYAFLSTSSDRNTAEYFTRSAEKRVIFEVEYIRACPGVDVELLSVYPAEKEILFPPCTGLSLKMPKEDEPIVSRQASDSASGLVRVTPTAANQ